MKSNSIGVLVVAAATILSACAGTHYRTISTAFPDDKADGIRYYEPAPFVLVYSDGKGGLNSSLIYLPDTTVKRVIKPYAWFAKNDATLTFEKGVLTEAKTIVDETIVPTAVLSAAKGAVLAHLAAADAGGKEPTTTVPPPALFRVFVQGGQVKLRGSYGVDAKGNYRDINITVAKPAKEEAE